MRKAAQAICAWLDPSPSRKSQSRTPDMIWSILKATILSVLFSISGCKEREKKFPTSSSPVFVRTQVVNLTDVPNIYSIPGTIISDGRTELSSRVVGLIQMLGVREGQLVTKGELLVKIDPSGIDQGILQARARLDIARDDLNDAEHDVVKFSVLAPQGIVPTESFRKAKVREDVARLTLASEEAALSTAIAQRTYTDVMSPFDGVIVKLQKHVGDMATVGVPILTIESREVLLFRIYVPESDVAKIRQDMTVVVHIDALAGRDVLGTVTRIVPSGDPVTRRYEVMLALPNDSLLLPGMFGRAELILGTSRIITVPQNCVTQLAGLEGVFVIGADDTARFRWLRMGRELEKALEITSGLSDGDVIVCQPGVSLHDGSLIARHPPQ